MGDIPGWAIPLGLAIKGPEVVGDIFNVYKGIRDSNREESDLEQAKFDLTQFTQNPDYNPDYTKYSDPLKAMKMGDAFKSQRTAVQKQDATQSLSALGEQYRDIAGTPNLRFYADPESRAEMVKAGLQIPDASKNPELRQGLAAFSEKAANQAALTDVYSKGKQGQFDPDLMAYVTENKDLAGSFDNATQGSKRLYDQANDTKGAKNLVDFAEAQGVAASYLLPNEGSQGRGKYQPAAQVRADAAAHLAEFALTDPQRNSINTMLDKGMEDTWVDGRNPYTGKADQEILTALRAEEAAARQEKAETAREERLQKTLAAAAKRQEKALAAIAARSEKKDAPKPAKPLPSAAANAIAGNKKNLRQATTALTLLNGGTIGGEMKNGKLVGGITGDKDAIGWKGYVPDTVLNRLDPKGTSTRAAIADLGSLVIHDRSGAAVTASEHPRLKPFIPLDTDDAPTAKRKLELFVHNYKEEDEALRSTYRASGYKLEDQSKNDTEKPIAPAGTKVPKKGGGHYTSDGKGGWK